MWQPLESRKHSKKTKREKRETRSQTVCVTSGSFQRSERDQQAIQKSLAAADGLSYPAPCSPASCLLRELSFLHLPQGSCCYLHESFPDTAVKKYLQFRASAFSCNCLLLQHVEGLQGCLHLVSTVPNLISNGTPKRLLGSRFPRANPYFSVFNSTIQRATRPGLTGILLYTLLDGKKPTH